MTQRKRLMKGPVLQMERITENNFEIILLISVKNMLHTTQLNAVQMLSSLNMLNLRFW